jgi:hypothetical protein
VVSASSDDALAGTAHLIGGVSLTSTAAGRAPAPNHHIDYHIVVMPAHHIRPYRVVEPTEARDAGGDPAA